MAILKRYAALTRTLRGIFSSMIQTIHIYKVTEHIKCVQINKDVLIICRS